MAKKNSKKRQVDATLQAWITARQRHRLSHAQVQMAREMGLNPKKLGQIDNLDQEGWKTALPEFLESLYQKRFGRSRPEKVVSLEERARERARKKQARREARSRRAALPANQPHKAAGEDHRGER